MNSNNFDGPRELKPLGAWSYVGLRILYAIPVIGFIFMLIFTFSSGNINRRSFTRSYWCRLLLVFLIIFSFFLIGRFSNGKQFVENITNEFPIIGTISEKTGLAELVSSARSYEEIYNDYAERIRTSSQALIEEFKNEAAVNTEGIDGLSGLASKTVQALAEIMADGADQMDQHRLLAGASSAEDYETWRAKLDEVYTEESRKIMDTYTALAMG